MFFHIHKYFGFLIYKAQILDIISARLVFCGLSLKIRIYNDLRREPFCDARVHRGFFQILMSVGFAVTLVVDQQPLCFVDYTDLIKLAFGFVSLFFYITQTFARADQKRKRL